MVFVELLRFFVNSACWRVRATPNEKRSFPRVHCARLKSVEEVEEDGLEEISTDRRRSTMDSNVFSDFYERKAHAGVGER